MNKTKTLLIAFALLASGSQASADLRIEFQEGAPKDRFTVKNISDCLLADVAVTIDLKTSAGKLIFDVTDQGAGVEVFQPFEVVSGSKFLEETPVVTDGQTAVTLKMSSFEAGATVVATTDVDDTIGAREITVKSSEFKGSVISVSSGDQVKTVTVGDRPAATVQLDGC